MVGQLYTGLSAPIKSDSQVFRKLRRRCILEYKFGMRLPAVYDSASLQIETFSDIYSSIASRSEGIVGDYNKTGSCQSLQPNVVY